MNSQLTITVHPRTLHFREPAGTSRGVYTVRKVWYVEARQADRRGWGECAPLPDLSCDAGDDYEERLREHCKATERTGQIDREAMLGCPSMLFGIETALWHLRRGTWQLSESAFGRREAGIPINGLVWMGSHREMLSRMEAKLKQGFRCIKLKIGAIGFDDELDLIRRVRARYNKEVVELRVDANGGFAPDEALERLTMLAQYDIHSCEQPIRQRQWQQMSELCSRSPLPIAFDEELIGVNTREEKANLLDRLHPQFIVLKPSLHGGIHGTREWIELARERGIGSWITSALESNIGLNAIAHLAAETYGDRITMPQGLGTGQLFTDNVQPQLHIIGDQLWASDFNAEATILSNDEKNG